MVSIVSKASVDRRQGCGRPDSRRVAPAFTAAASAVAALLSGASSAQDAPVEEVVVTGSRIARTSGFATAVPVTAVSPEDLTSY